MDFVKRDGVSLGASGLSGPGRAGPSTGQGPGRAGPSTDQGLAGPPPSNGFVADGQKEICADGVVLPHRSTLCSVAVTA